ncbi:hypothetical protein D1839_15000 [Roseburia sp. 1XD42-34]|nr:hypothetical protein [Roseburia sp. 1XD42-34]RKI75830.1 hypothetical protein D7V87_14925 [Clostridium sp. 1xD42-85]
MACNLCFLHNVTIMGAENFYYKSTRIKPLSDKGKHDRAYYSQKIIFRWMQQLYQTIKSAPVLRQDNDVLRDRDKVFFFKR